MATINILIAADGALIAEKVRNGTLKPGTQSSPTNLGSYGSSDVYISMIAPHGSVINNTQGQSELEVKAKGGDDVVWAITTFNNNFDQTPYLYAGTFNPDNAITKPLSYSSGQSYVYLSTGNPPTTPPTKFINQVNTATGKVLKVNVRIQYYLSFTLVNNDDGSIIGYFSWDPFIKVQ